MAGAAGGDRRLPIKTLVLLFLVACAARMAWVALDAARSPDPTALEFPDERDYWSIGESLARGDGLVGEHGFRALRMPLYPALLSVFVRSAGGVLYAKATQCVLGALAAALAGALAARVAGRPAGILAGALVACDPFLIFFSSLLLTETLYVTVQCVLLLATWPLLDDRAGRRRLRWVTLGLLSALCVYMRESSALLCVSWIVFLVAARRCDRSSMLGGAVAVIVLVAALLPWALRNQRVTGHLCWLTHRGGISLYDGVGPQATGAGDLGNIKQMPAVRDLDEAAWNRYFLDESIKSIRENPARILRLAAVKIARTWNPVPNVDTYQSRFVRFVSAAWTVPIYAFALIGAGVLFRDNRPALGALLLPALCVLLLHSVFVGSVRYRLVAMPMLEIIAAVGACAIYTKWSPKRAAASFRASEATEESCPESEIRQDSSPRSE